MTISRTSEIDGYERAALSSFRLARFSVFLDLINSIRTMDRPLRILDVGGIEAYWRDKKKLIIRPAEITLINLEGGQPADSSVIHCSFALPGPSGRNNE